MKTTIKLFTFSALAILLFTLFSCSNNLSRGKAEDLIVNKYRLPKVESNKIDKIYAVGRNTPDEDRMLDDFKSKGLITITEKYKEWDAGFGFKNHVTQMIVELTSEGKKYLVKEVPDNYYLVRTCETAFGEITGIQVNEQFKAAQVTLHTKED